MKRLKKVLKICLIIAAVLVPVVVLVDGSVSASIYKKGDYQMNKIKQSPQYSDGKFRNAAAWKQPMKEMPSTLWKFIFGGEERSPAGDLPIKKVDVSHFNRTGGQQLNATWLGHSSVMINLDGYKIMTDPVLQKRVSIVGPSRYNGEVPLDAGALSDIDVIIISHNHYDHLNKYTIQKLKGKTKLFIVPLGVGAQLRKWGVAESKIVELDWWDEYQVHQDLKIAATPTQHFSGRSLSDRDSTLWASFAVIGPKHKVFFSGDSGYFDGFKKIGETYGPFDMTFMECGAYNERWHHIHMYPEETVQAHLDVKGKVLHPIHWGTFNLSLHAWYEPMQRFTKAAAAAGVRTATPIAGDTVVYGQYMGTEKWWAGYMSTQSPMPKKKTRRLEGSIHPLAGQ